MAERCSERVYNDTYGSNQCRRQSVVVEDGKPWCRQHSPSAVKARRAKSDARIKAMVQESLDGVAQVEEMRRRADAFPALLEALENVRAILHGDNCQQEADCWPACEEASTAIALAKKKLGER